MDTEPVHDRAVHLSVRLDAAPETVWTALTDPHALQAWFWPPRLRPAVTADPQPGGRYRIAAGAVPMAVSGRYEEVAPPHRLVMSWAFDGDERTSRVTVTLAGDADGTDVAVAHEGLDEETATLYGQGWNDCLERLPGYLAGGPVA